MRRGGRPCTVPAGKLNRSSPERASLLSSETPDPIKTMAHANRSASTERWGSPVSTKWHGRDCVDGFRTSLLTRPVRHTVCPENHIAKGTRDMERTDMNTTIISTDVRAGKPGSTAMPLVRRRFTTTWAGTAMPLVAAVVLIFCTAGSCLAVDQPPQEPDQQCAWLVGHLVTDMEALGVRCGGAHEGAGNCQPPDQRPGGVGSAILLLDSAKTEQDSGLYAVQQRGDTDEQVAEAKAEVADLLTAMHEEIVACREQFVLMPQPVLYLANICYATVPGWCCRARCFVPDWYYDDGCYVGPCYDSAYAGIWAVPVCRHTTTTAAVFTRRTTASPTPFTSAAA